MRPSSALAAGSSDTVTLVSEVETRSTDSPWSLNTAKASARKPTWCHMPSVSIDEQRDALLDANRLDACAAIAARRRHDRAHQLRCLRGMHGERDRILLHRQDAARMQHLGAAARDFLCLVVVERLQQARVRHRLRVGREHARHVRPDLQPPCAELGGKVTAGRIRAAAPEQHRIASRVARDESLRDQHLAARGQALLELGIGFEIAGRRKVVRALGRVGPLFGMQQRACVEPLRVDALVRQERRTECAWPSTRRSPSRARAGGH